MTGWKESLQADCLCRKSVQLLARVKTEENPYSAEVQVSVLACERNDSVICRKHASSSTSPSHLRNEKLIMQIPVNKQVLTWFERKLGEKFVGKNIKAQITWEDNLITLYYDSRFDFDCYSTDSPFNLPTGVILDSQQLEESQRLALVYFGPRRVPSGFRRRQKLLHQLYNRYERRIIQHGWDKIRRETNYSGRMSSRLLEILSRNMEKSRQKRAVKSIFYLWREFVRIRFKQRRVLDKYLKKLLKNYLRNAFILWYRNSATARVADLLKEFNGADKLLTKPIIKRQVMSILNSDSHLCGRFSPDVIVNVLMNASAMLSPCVAQKSFTQKGKGFRGKGRSLSANSQFLPSTPPFSPYSPSFSSCSPKHPFNLISQRQKNTVGPRRVLNGFCYPPRPLKLASRVVLESDTPDEQNTSFLPSNTSNDLSAWRQQAMLQQKKLRSNSALANSTINSQREHQKKFIEKCTPLSAQLVSKWSFVSTAPKQKSPLPESYKENQEMNFVQAARATPATMESYISSATRTTMETVVEAESASVTSSSDESNKKETLKKLLQSIHLEHFYSNFESEELCDLGMLTRMCIDNRQEFKKILCELGLKKIGQREKLVMLLLHQERKRKEERKKRKKKRRRQKQKCQQSPGLEPREDDTALYNAAILNRHKVREENTKKKIEQYACLRIRRLEKAVIQELTKTSPKTGLAYARGYTELKPERVINPIHEYRIPFVHGNCVRERFYSKLGLD